MVYKVDIKRKDDDESPLEVSVNVTTGKLKINNREITLENYNLIQGPFETEQKPWISVRYEVGKTDEREKDILKLESIPTLKVDRTKNDEEGGVLFTEISFPSKTLISCSNYDLS